MLIVSVESTNHWLAIDKYRWWLEVCCIYALNRVWISAAIAFGVTKPPPIPLRWESQAINIYVNASSNWALSRCTVVLKIYDNSVTCNNCDGGRKKLHQALSKRCLTRVSDLRWTRLLLISTGYCTITPMQEQPSPDIIDGAHCALEQAQGTNIINAIRTRD